MTVAIVGYGSIGRRHAENLRGLGVKRLIIVRRRQGANPAFEPPADATIVHDVHAAIEQGADVAIICNPTQWHVEAALPLVAAGKPVLVEKPIAADVRSTRKLRDVAVRHGTRCGMAYCMRYHPAYALARETLRQGRLGRLLYAKAWFESYLPDWHPWEDYRQSYAARRELGGGVLPTLDHEIDFLNWCLGPPHSVTGVSRRSGTLESDVDDSASLRLEYADGVTATCVLSFCRRDRQRGFEFVGSQASLRYSQENGRLLLCRADASDDEVLWDGRHDATNQMYVDLVVDFLDSVATGRRPPIPLEAGIESLAVMEQVRSAGAA